MDISKKKIAVLGADGFLGSRMMQYFESDAIEVVAVARYDVNGLKNDFSNYDVLSGALNKISPDLILNCAGYVNVDNCEAFPNNAYLGNVKIVESLVKWNKLRHKPAYLIHISTDHIYDGFDGAASCENDVKIRNVYGFSKYAGELVLLNNPHSIIIRTNFIGASLFKKKPSFSDWLYLSSKNKDKIVLFSDIFFNPLSLKTLYSCIKKIANKELVGTYNLGSSYGMSKYELGVNFLHKVGLSFREIEAIVTRGDSSGLSVKRPKNMMMSLQKIESSLNLKLPNLESEIETIANEYESIWYEN